MRDQPVRFGFYAAMAAFAGAVLYSAVQILQVLGVLGWPVADILIYASSFLIAWPFMLAMLALLFITPAGRRIWAAACLLFSAIYASYVAPLYVLQIASGIPLALRGTPDPVFAVNRYSAFWVYDGMGYICMGLATLFASMAFDQECRAAKGFFLANGLFTAVIAFVYFWPSFSVGLLLFGLPWIITAPGAILSLALVFRRKF